MDWTGGLWRTNASDSGAVSPAPMNVRYIHYIMYTCDKVWIYFNVTNERHRMKERHLSFHLKSRRLDFHVNPSQSPKPVPSRSLHAEQSSLFFQLNFATSIVQQTMVRFSFVAAAIVILAPAVFMPSLVSADTIGEKRVLRSGKGKGKGGSCSSGKGKVSRIVPWNLWHFSCWL